MAEAFARLAHRYDAWYATPLGAWADRLAAAAMFRLLDVQPGERLLDPSERLGQRLRRPGVFWHLSKVLFERYWLGEGLERMAARTALALGARALGVPDPL